MLGVMCASTRTLLNPPQELGEAEVSKFSWRSCGSRGRLRSRCHYSLGHRGVNSNESRAEGGGQRGTWKSVEGVTCTGSGAQGWEKRGGGLAMF